MQNIKGLLIALSIESTIAWQLLRLRHIARHEPDSSGKPLLSEKQYEAVIRLQASWGQQSAVLSVGDVIDELARRGVHLKNNGPPGWMVLKRGLRKLNLLAEGMSLAATTNEVAFEM